MTSSTTLILLTHLLLLTFKIDSLSSDGLTLLSLKSAVEPATSGIHPFSDWVETDPNPCKWSGITCNNSTNDNEPRVTGISIANRGLHGYIPSELGSLTYLRRLNLHNNKFNGSIPDQLFNATSLHSIFLYGNNLSGPLPSSLCKLPKLQNVDLSANLISGEIPRSLKDCKQLQRLILSDNKFSDQIPAGIWSEMMNLVQLDLSDNELTGKIPDDLGDLQSLSGTLNLSFNHLSGEIPKKLGELPMTVSFDLRSNNLSGEIPQTGSFANQGPTAFLGNPLLCGFPLQRACKHDQNVKSPAGSERTRGNPSGHKGLSPGLILLISAADAIAVAIVGLFIIYLYWKKKDSSSTGCSCTGTIKLGSKTKHPSLCCCMDVSGKNDETNESDSGSSRDGNNNNNNNGGGELVAIDKGFEFEIDELLRASAYVLGKSGFGIVYKVVLGNGVPVAVRRLGEGGGDQQRYKEFSNEIHSIGKVKHPNVVRLRAYYWAPDEKLLISDFISNANLASALRGKTGETSTSLTWTTRLKIAKGTARGLAYIHECSPRKFVHGDIKPSNILLDNDNHPYISDFGLNRLISITGGANHSSSASSGGFMGGALPYTKPINPEKPNFYKAPEARIPGSRPAQKWDVYSFGVVLLELLTGKSPEYSPPTTSSSSEIHDLVRWVRNGFDNECPLSEMVDPVLLQQVHAKKEIVTVFHVALACTHTDPEIRPRMKTVAETLYKIGS